MLLHSKCPQSLTECIWLLGFDVLAENMPRERIIELCNYETITYSICILLYYNYILQSRLRCGFIIKDIYLTHWLENVSDYYIAVHYIYIYIYIYISKGKGKAIQLQAWTGPEGSGGWSSQISRISGHESGKAVIPTHRPSLPPGNIPGTHFC